jgi:carboxymethylenebutenolidase
MCMDTVGSCVRSSSRRAVLLVAAAGIGVAQKVPPPTRVLDDPAIVHGLVRFRHNGVDTIDGYLARPKGDGRHPAVLVIAGNKISEEYIPNTCAALALAGMVGLAPNVQHPLPESARTNEEYAKYLRNHRESDRLDDIQSGASYFRTQPFVTSGPFGIMGFCRGGRDAPLFGARSREVEPRRWQAGNSDFGLYLTDTATAPK